MEIPNDDLTSANIKPGADLRGADLSEADLDGVDLSRADLNGANLSEANLHEANLSEADLGGIDLSEAILIDANLSRTFLLDADLSGIALSRGTQVELGLTTLERMVSQVHVSEDSKMTWDAIARLNHKLKTAYSANGLVGQARRYRVQERQARAKEAKTEGGISGYGTWLGSHISHGITGYGVQLRWPISIMLGLYVVATAVYWQAGIENSLYYSVITFTTSPPGPHPPPGGLLTEITAMIETFAGTLLIVLLGYVLGNREQV